VATREKDLLLREVLGQMEDLEGSQEMPLQNGPILPSVINIKHLSTSTICIHKN